MPARVVAAPVVAPRPAPTQSPFDARNFSRFLQDQGKSNACGTTSLAMLMSFWRGTPNAVTHQQIDRSIRQFDLPTSPLNIAPFLRSQGLRAEAYNNSNLATMRGFLDRGVPVQVLYDPSANRNDQYLHYVNVVGYQADAHGQISSVQIADPAGGVLRSVPVAEFQRRWGNLGLNGVDTGINNAMVVALPKSGNVVGRDGVTRSVKDIALPRGGGFGLRAHVADAFMDAANVAGKVSSAWTSMLHVVTRSPIHG